MNKTIQAWKHPRHFPFIVHSLHLFYLTALNGAWVNQITACIHASTSLFIGIWELHERMKREWNQTKTKGEEWDFFSNKSFICQSISFHSSINIVSSANQYWYELPADTLYSLHPTRPIDFKYLLKDSPDNTYNEHRNSKVYDCNSEVYPFHTMRGNFIEWWLVRHRGKERQAHTKKYVNIKHGFAPLCRK